MNRKTIYIGLVLLVVATIAGYNYLYQDHRDIQAEEAFYTGTAVELKNKFSQSDLSDIINKTVIITGKVTGVEEGGVTLDEAAFVSLDSRVIQPKIGQNSTIKGRCIGYDELFELVSIDQATLID